MNEVQVLVVDDNDINLIVAEELLGSLGLVVDTASSGEMAIELLEDWSYQLIFMDKSMPDMDGIETTAKLRAMGYKIPVIALTADDAPDSGEWFKAQGLDDYLAKPLEMAKLQEMVVKWLPGSLCAQENHVAEPAEASLLTDLQAKCGLNAADALNRMGVPEKSYLQVVQTLYRRLPDTVAELSGAMEAGDLELYRIRVHGCKSALANVGADIESELARELETAAGNLDQAFVKSKNPPLINALNALYERLTAEQQLFVPQQAGGSAQAGNRQQLDEGLDALESLLDDLDNDGAAELLSELTGFHYTPEIDAGLAAIKGCVDDFDYDGAAEGIRKIRSL